MPEQLFNDQVHGNNLTTFRIELNRFFKSYLLTVAAVNTRRLQSITLESSLKLLVQCRTLESFKI